MSERSTESTVEAPTPEQSGVRLPVLRGRLTAQGVEVVGILLILVAIIVVFSIVSDRFLTVDNGKNILEAVAVAGMIAIGQTLVIISGGFDLSVAGTVPLAAVVYAKLCNSGLDWPLAMVLAVCVGAGVGAINGAIVTRARINPLIATLATLSIAGGLAYQITSGQSVALESDAAGTLAESGFADISNHVWLVLGLGIVGTFVLRRTTFGKALYALGGNREASWLAGMRVDLLTASVYVISGGLAALGGVVLAGQLLAADGSLGQDAALLSIAAVVLGGASLTGGTGSILGTLVGVLILGSLADGLTLARVSTYSQDIITGIVLLVAVGFGQLRSAAGRSH